MSDVPPLGIGPRRARSSLAGVAHPAAGLPAAVPDVWPEPAARAAGVPDVWPARIPSASQTSPEPAPHTTGSGGGRAVMESCREAPPIHVFL